MSDTSTPKRGAGRASDVITISGRPDDCEAAKNALLSLIPVDVEVQVPYDYHRFIIGQKGKDVRELMERFDVAVSVPPPNEKRDSIRITGAAEKANAARDAILSRVKQLEDEKQEREARSFRVELHVDPAVHPKIIGRKGAVVSKIRTKYDVQIQFPERNATQNGVSKPQDQTLITVIGYEDKALAAKEEIMSLVKDLESVVSREVRVDARVHPRLIGARGKSIRRVMEQFKVDVRFARSSDPDPNVIVISGREGDVDAAKDHILTLEEEYVSSLVCCLARCVSLTSASQLEDQGVEYAPPKVAQSGGGDAGGSEKTAAGFVVKGAPWNQRMPDTSNCEEFPSMGASGENGGCGSGSAAAWGRSQ